MLKHWKLKCWKIKHQVITFWVSVLWLKKIERGCPTQDRTTTLVMFMLWYLVPDNKKEKLIIFQICAYVFPQVMFMLWYLSFTHVYFLFFLWDWVFNRLYYFFLRSYPISLFSSLLWDSFFFILYPQKSLTWSNCSHNFC